MWIAFVNGLINEPHYIYNNGKYYNKHAIDKNILAKDRSPIPTRIYHEILRLVPASKRLPTILLLVLYHSPQA